ncbi:TIGR03364 family FAD-dependent oxidoreductase [Elioraea sp.]|uniref:TIGR03364 family FAD-dependent oxidoreductase n=1 Tax=Elioraea sp. TaxID=2185103 RepID=UPI00307FBAFC
MDVVVIGAGIVGLAHALAAARAGLSVTVIEREARANGASVRNFGFVTITGQPAGETWRRAVRSREIWAEVCGAAGIPVLHRGLLMAARRPEARAVIEEFAQGPMGEGCRILSPAELPHPLRRTLAGALASPHELRVEPREALPRLAAWLEAHHGVQFRWRTHAWAIARGRVETSRGPIAAARVVICPGNEFLALCPETIAAFRPVRCKLAMLRLADPGWRLPAAVMSDLGLVRYGGYRHAASLPDLRARLESEQPAHLAQGVHLIVVQSADGTLVVGDSHDYADTPDPFLAAETEALILDEARAVLDLDPALPVIERWVGEYPAAAIPAFIAAPTPESRVVMVTSGTGMSTAFALAEETLASFGVTMPVPA